MRWAAWRHRFRFATTRKPMKPPWPRCAPLYNLMEDAATAEICRAQLWQWIRHEARMENGATVTAERFDLLLGAELEQVHHQVGTARFRFGAFSTAVRLFSSMVKNDSFDEFLTLPAYQLLP